MKTIKKTGLLLYISILCCQYSFAGNNEVSVRVAYFKGDRNCAISYTFDDGLKEHYTLAAPELEKRNFRGTFWINGKGVNETGNIIDTTRITWAELKEMADKGHEISNHGWAHLKLTTISMEEVKVEIDRNDSIILAKTGIPSLTFCYPYNARNDEVTQMASENRIDTRTRQHSIGYESTPENLDKWVNSLMEANKWGIGMTHGITYGYDAFGNPQRFWDHLDKVKALDNKIWVGTFREVAAYVKERDNIKLDIRKKKNRITVVPDLQLDKNLFTEPLTMVVDKSNIRKITVKQNSSLLPVIILEDKAVFDFNPYGGEILIEVK